MQQYWRCQMESFALPIEAMRARRGIKWRRYGDEVVPASIADMDFAVAEPVQRAIRSLVDQHDYGYAHREGHDRVESAFADRMRARFGWDASNERTVLISDVLQGIAAAILAFSEPGDGVVVQTPIYPPFLSGIDGTGRRRVLNPLVDSRVRLDVDAEGLRGVVDDRTRILLLCNPHNPSGRALEREELATRTITLNSATKGFNIAGLRCAVMHFGSEELLAGFGKAFPERLLGGVSAIGIDATIAAWREGQPWLDGVMERLLANRDRLAAWVADAMPAVQFYPPEATYLGWLDCSQLALPAASPQEFFLKEAGVALGLGSDFGPGAESCVRLNFATSAPILEEVL